MTGCRTRRRNRIASSAEFGEIARELSKLESTCNSNWQTQHRSIGDLEGTGYWLVTPISHGNRDEDALADSNFEVAEKMLEEASNFGETDYRCDAWVGGVISTLMIRSDDAGAIRALNSIIRRLEDYPILDEEHFSELEYERNHPGDHECYAEDCSCSVAVHRAEPEPDHSGLEADDDGEAWCGICGDWVSVPVAEGN